MSAVENVKTLMVALQSGDMEQAAERMSDDFIISGLFPKSLSKGQLLGVQSELLAALPDFSYNLREVKSEEDSVQAWIGITGTHTNDLALPIFGIQAIPATGLAIVLPQAQVMYQLIEGKVAEMSVEVLSGGGLSGLLQQVGAELPLQARERDLSE